MRYVLLGTLSAQWAEKHQERVQESKKKLKDLKIELETVAYTQGPYDFVDIVEAPDAEAMLAFSLWYADQGFGRIVSCPAFDHDAMLAALKKI